MKFLNHFTIHIAIIRNNTIQKINFKSSCNFYALVIKLNNLNSYLNMYDVLMHILLKDIVLRSETFSVF